jgi:hypothetical protein
VAAAYADIKTLETSFLDEYSENSLRNFLYTCMRDFSRFKIFAKKISENTLSVNHRISNRYLMEVIVKKDTEETLKHLELSQKINDRPNAYDLMAEYYATLGDKENTLKNQFKVFSLSPYLLHTEPM